MSAQKVGLKTKSIFTVAVSTPLSCSLNFFPMRDISSSDAIGMFKLPMWTAEDAIITSKLKILQIIMWNIGMA